MDIIGLFFIFFARIVDVSCSTIRILFLVRGRRLLATCIGFFEITLYITVLGRIMGGGREMTLLQTIFYAGGFAAGTYFGSLLEERLMNAYVLLDLIMNSNGETDEMIRLIRGDGYGATVLSARGRDGDRYVVKIICRRSDIPAITNRVQDKAFICISEVKGISGGFFRLKNKK